VAVGGGRRAHANIAAELSANTWVFSQPCG
jgi:hypothetical protein